MGQGGKLRQNLAFCAGAGAAILGADALLIAMHGMGPRSRGLVHHLEFLGTLMLLVGLGGALGLRLPPQRVFAPGALAAMGALAAIAGFAIGVALMPALGETASIVAIVVAAASVPRIAALWPRTVR